MACQAPTVDYSLDSIISLGYRKIPMLRRNVFRRMWLAVSSMKLNEESYWEEYQFEDLLKLHRTARKRTVSDTSLPDPSREDPVPKPGPRSKSVHDSFEPRRMPQAKWHRQVELECRLAEIEDDKLRTKVFLQETQKEKQKKIAMARDRKSSKMKVFTPQMRRATRASEGSPDPLSLRTDQVEPQMYNPFKMMVPSQFDTLAETAQAFNTNFSNDILPQLKEFNSNVAALREGVPIRHEVSQELGDQLTTYASKLTDLLVVVLIISVVCIMKPKTPQERILVSVMIGGFLITRTSLRDLFSNSALMKWFRKPESESENVDPQMLTFGNDTSEMLCGLINMYMCYDHGVEIFSPKKFVRIMTDLGRATASFQTIIGGMTKVVNFIFEGIDSWMNGRPFFLSTGFSFIDNFVKEADAIISEFEAKTLFNLQSSVDRVNRCLEVGDAISLKIPSYPAYAGLRLKITGLLQELKKIRKTLLSSNFRFSGIRQEPVVLFLRGPPGVGKSMALQHIAHAVSAITLEKDRFALYKEQPSSAIYNRQAENKYWDGYTMGHDIVFFDDILQARDVIGEPDNEAMNLIRCANIFEAQLHCAAIESKGVTNFRSNWILATSNSESIKLESITDVGAFMRRLTCTYDVTVKPEFAVDPAASRWERRIDKNKLPKYTEKDGVDPSWVGHTRLTMDCLEFHPQVLKGRATKAPSFEDRGTILSFDEVIKELHQAYLDKKIEADMYRHQLEETLGSKRQEYHGDDVSEEQLNLFYDALEMESMEPQSGRRQPAEERLPLRAMDHPGFYDAYDVRWYDVPSLSEAEKMWWCQFVHYHIDVGFIDLESIKRGKPGNYCLLVQLITLFGNRDKLPEGWSRIQTLVEEWLDEKHSILFDTNDWSVKDVRTLVEWDDNEMLSLIAYCLDNVHLMYIGPDDDQYGRNSDDDFSPQMNRRTSSPSPKYISNFAHDSRHQELLNLLKDESEQFYNSVRFLEHSFLIRRNDLVGDAVVQPDDILDAILLEGSFRTFKIGFSDVMTYLLRIAEIYSETHRPTNSETRLQSYNGVRDKLIALKPVVPKFFSKMWDLWKSCAGYLYELGSGSAGSLYGSSGRPSPYVLFVGAASTAGVALAVKGILSLIGMFFSKDESNPQSDERHSRIARGRVGKRIIKVLNNKASARPEGMMRANENMTAIMQMVLKNNLFTLHVPVPKAERESSGSIKYAQTGSCLGLKGRVVLMPYHFGDSILQEVEDGQLSMDDVVILKRVGISDPYFMLTVEELCNGMTHSDIGEKRDVLAVTLPKRFQPVRDIVKFFVPEKQQDLYKTVRVGLCIPGSHVVEFHAAEARRRTSPITVGNEEYCNYDVAECYEYIARTTAGDCGSPLFVDDKASHAVIIGMHVAGYESGRLGVSAVLTRELIETLLKIPGNDYSEFDQLSIPLDPPQEEMPNFLNLGRVNPEMRTPSRQGRSAIVRSPLYGKVTPVKRAPARLLPFKGPNGSKIDPLDVALSSYCTPDVHIPQLKLCAARESLYDMLMSCSPHGVDRVIYSFEEGVLGDGAGSEFGPVPRMKSAGFPYNVMNGLTSKCRFFGSDVDYNLDNPECNALREECNAIIRNAENGVRMMHVFTDALKDERRSLAKVVAGKTRMFSGSPTPLLIVSRQYFGAFQKWIVRNRIHNGIAIGVNEYSSEWDFIARRLECFGKIRNVGAGDYQGFDQKHKPAVMWEILRIIQDWYGYDDPKATKVREILWFELVNSRHVVKEHLVAWPSSMPSGHPLTALVNCLYNHMLFRMCWIDLVNPKRLDAHSFNKYVYLIVLGDDNVFSVQSKYTGVFNEGNLQKAMARYGEIYTPEDKESTNFGEKLRSLGEVTFLKRRFRYSRSAGRYLAPLEIDAILDILNWNKNGANILGDTEDAVTSVLGELTLHGEEVFNYWKQKILSAVQTTPGLGYPPVTGYSVLLRSVLSRELGYNSSERFSTDYDEVRENAVVPESVFRRFGELRAGLFSLTSRMAPLQSREYPGAHGNTAGLAPPVSVKLSC